MTYNTLYWWRQTPNRDINMHEGTISGKLLREVTNTSKVTPDLSAAQDELIMAFHDKMLEVAEQGLNWVTSTEPQWFPIVSAAYLFFSQDEDLHCTLSPMDPLTNKATLTIFW